MSRNVVPGATAPSIAPLSAPPHGNGVVVRKSPRGRQAKNREPVSRDAQRVAAGILEVLAGVRTPTETAKTLGLSVPRYYLWEQRALEGLVRACEPRPKGKAASERHRIAVLEKELGRLRQECIRQQALVRASQRTIGLTAPPFATKPVTKGGNKADAKTTAKVADGSKAKRKRRPVARALKAAAALQAVPSQGETLADSSSANGTEVVQRTVLDSLLQAAAATGAVAAVSGA